MRLVFWVGALALGAAVALLAEVPADAIGTLAPVPVCAACLLLLRADRCLWAQSLAACAIGLYGGSRALQPPELARPLAAVVDSDNKVSLQGWVTAGPEPAMPRPGSRLRIALEQVAWGRSGFAAPSLSREGLGTLPGSPSESVAWGRSGFAAPSLSREGLGTLPGSPSESVAWGRSGFAAPSPSREGLGTLPGSPLESVRGQPARATVALSVAAGVPDLRPGDPVEFQAKLRSVRGLANPGLPDPALQVRATGVDLFAGLGAASAIRRLGGAEVSFPWRARAMVLGAAAGVRLALGRAIDRAVTAPAATLLHTAVLGERRSVPPQVEDGFRAAGATHVLSVSGLHLAAVGVVFFHGIRRLFMLVPRLPLWIEPRASAALVAMPAVAFYTLITGAAIATVRSALMMLFGFLGLALGRRNTPLVAITAAVLVLLGWSPLVMVDVSFQLSVLSVLALAILVPRLLPSGATPERRVRGRLAGATGRIVEWSCGLVAATMAAGFVTAPLVAHHFGEVTPAAPVGNLLLVPLVEMGVVPFGLLGSVVGATLGRTCSLPLLWAAQWAAELALSVAELFRDRAPVWLTRAPNTFETTALCLGLACTLAVLRSRMPGRSIMLGVGAVLIAAAASSLAVRDIARRVNPDLIVTFLDVGQGDAAVVQFPGGSTMVIDGGGSHDGSFDPGARVVEPFLRARGITRLQVVALSHPHADHLGGLHRLLERFDVDSVWTSGDDGHNPDYLRFMATARARAISSPRPAPWVVNGVLVEPMGPYVARYGANGSGKPSEQIGVPEGTTVNDASLVLRVSRGGRAILFSGDLEASGEGELVGRTTLGQTVASDVLKVPHHGSRTSSTDELLEAVRPRLAVISLGWKNRFNFPRPEVLERYRARRIRVLRTDRDGGVTITITPQGGLDATCARRCR